MNQQARTKVDCRLVLLASLRTFMYMPSHEFTTLYPLQRDSRQPTMEDVSIYSEASSILVSVIVPVHNASKFLPELLQSVIDQTHRPLELSCWNDSSKDDSFLLLQSWKSRLLAADISVCFGENPKSTDSRGPGYARNRAVRQSSGRFLCFLDADDIMLPRRVQLQMEAARMRPHSLIGCQFMRIPRSATPRYSRWCNEMSSIELWTHRFRDCTIVQPTWFMSRHHFELVGGYVENSLAEDLIFFYEFLELIPGASLHRVDEVLLEYRQHANSLTHRVPRDLLLRIRVSALERQVLRDPHWNRFSIWGAGRDGRRFLRALSPSFRAQVDAFCDIDPAKLKLGAYQARGEFKKPLNSPVPIVHFKDVQPPLITCVTLDRGDCEFERNLQSLGLREGVDVVFFC